MIEAPYLAPFITLAIGIIVLAVRYWKGCYNDD